LSGNGSANNEDDRIIISDPSYSGSYIYLTSNDDLVIELDNNSNEDGSFRIRNSSNTDIFTVNETGYGR
jgi:hypothetical protein